jgi:hypothetical protein
VPERGGYQKGKSAGWRTVSQFDCRDAGETAPNFSYVALCTGDMGAIEPRFKAELFMRKRQC